MKKIKISLDLFFKSKWMNISIILELAISLCFGVLVISIIDKEYECYSLIKDIDDAYIYISETDIFDLESNLYLYQKQGKIRVTKFIEEDIWSYNVNETDPEKAYLTSQYHIDSVYPVDGIREEVMKKELKIGRWFNSNLSNNQNQNNQDRIIECVIIGDEQEFPIGTIIDGGLFELTYIREENKLNWEIKVKYQFKVVGILGPSVNFFKFNTQTNPPEALLARDMFKEINYGNDNFFEKIAIDYSEDNVNKDRVPKVSILCSPLDNLEGLNNGKNAMFVFDENVTDSEKDGMLDTLKKEASVTSFDNIKENEKNLAINSIMTYLPLLVCFVTIIITALICTSVLTYINNQKMFDTFVICGMGYKDGIKINSIYGLFVVWVSLIVGFVLWTVLSFLGVIPWYNMNFGNSSLVYVIISFIVYFLLISVVSSLVLRKEYKLK